MFECFLHRNAYEMQKAFKLRFNGLLLEEDVHVFPTSPPSRYNPPPTPKGILRRKKSPPPAPAEQTGCPSKASSSDSSGDEAETKTASNRPSNGQLPSPIVRLEGTVAVPSSPPSSGPGSPQKSWYSATSSEIPHSYSYSSSAQRSKSSEAKTENGVIDTALLNGGRGRGRGELHSPPDSPPRLPLSVSDYDSVRSRSTDAVSNSYSNGGRMQDGRNILTAEDCMRNIMMDLRASSAGEDEKTSRNGSNRNGSSIGSWNYLGSPGYSALRDTDYSDPSDRLLYRGGYADAKEKEKEKEKDPYEDLGSLSLHDLAALPLHFEKTADHLDSKVDSGTVGKYYPSGTSIADRQGYGDKYKTDHGDEAYDDYSSNRYPSSSKSSSREGSSSSSSSKRTSSHSYEATRSGSDEVERTDNPLASFQRLGQEGAVRVQYSSLLLPPSASYPTKTPLNAWQGSAYKEKDKDRTLASRSSVRSTEFKSTNDIGAGTESDRRAEREKEKEKEKPLRTYRSLLTPSSMLIIRLYFVQ
jgi:hypothetical protein